jgi:hypothetical protein
MKLSIFFLCILSMSFEAVRGRRERPLVIMYLVPGIWRISKSNSRIHASHRVNKVFSKSILNLLS